MKAKQLGGLFISALFLTAPVHASAQTITVECEFAKSGKTQFSRNGPRDSYVDFTYTGRYRVNTSPKQSVTANFTVVDEDEYANSVSRFIEDVRLIDDLQIIFCEDGMNRCAKAEVDTGRATGWRHIQPTVLNLEDMTVSGGEESYYSSANGATWMSNKFTTTGTCRRL